MSSRMKRHLRAISQMGNDAKRQKIVVETQAQETDVESDDEEVDISDIPKSEVFDFFKMEDRSSDSAGLFKYQRGPQASTWTKWRHAKEAKARGEAAKGCHDIRTMMLAKASDRNVVPSGSAVESPVVAPPEAGRHEILTRAVHDLEKRLRSKRFIVNGQTNTRYQAVRMFMNRQIAHIEKSRKFTRKATALEVAEALGKGSKFARCLVSWEIEWLRWQTIPEGRRGQHTKVMSVFDDEDVLLFVREYITNKGESVTSRQLAEAVTEYLGNQAMGNSVEEFLDEATEEPLADQNNSSETIGIKKEAARLWLHKLGLSWRSAKKTVYFDGHERDDVVAYRQQFVQEFLDLEARFVRWTEDGEMHIPTLPAGQRPIVPVTHDESTFHSNDGRRYMWLAKGKDPIRPKNMGRGIMVSDFLTPGGRLSVRRNDEVVRATEYGPDNYWTGEKMVAHTLEIMLPLFEEAFPPDQFQGLFLFDNATNHCSMAPDALVAANMNLHPGGKAPIMRDGYWGSPRQTQRMWEMGKSGKIPRGIKAILEERGLWPQGRSLKLACSKKGEHTPDNNCCARKLMAAQPDFLAQTGKLHEKLVEAGHLVKFFPKFHPELNFIEPYWGAAKRYAREHCEYTFDSLRVNVPSALDSVSPVTINRFYEKSLRTMRAYRDGLKLGTQEFEDRVYRSHRRV